MYSSAPTPDAEMCASACRSARGPSKTSDRASSGSGGTRLTQTMNENASGTRAVRSPMLPSPHIAAPATHSANASTGLPWPSVAAISAIPANATAIPAIRRTPGRSRSIRPRTGR